MGGRLEGSQRKTELSRDNEQTDLPFPGGNGRVTEKDRAVVG